MIRSHIYKISIALLLLMVVGANTAWGAFTEGLYYIKSNANTDFYLCPSIGGYYGNNVDQPHLTTFKTGGDQYSIWKIVPVDGETDTYYIIHYKTGRYLKSNEDFTTDNGSKHNRKAVHLEVKPETLTDDFKFLIKNNSSPYQIYPKSYYTNASGMSFNPTGEHKECYAPADGGVHGIIGLFNKTNTFSQWQIPAVPSASKPCATPIVKYVGDNISISYPYSEETGITIYYTTDGTDPSTSGTRSSYSSPISATGVIKVRAIATKTDFVNSDEAVLWGSARPFLIQSQECADYYLAPSGNGSNVCTISIPGMGMQWTLQNAGASTGGIQYYYVVNSNGKKIYYNSENNGLSLNDASDDVRKFCVIENGYNTGSFFLIPVSQTNRVVYKVSGNVSNAHSKAELNKQWNTNLDQWIFSVCNESADQKNLFSPAPFSVSNDSETHYYHIASVGADGYYIVPPTDPDGYATTSNTSSDYTDNPWLFKVAASDNWQTFYYIINAASGKYMYFNPNNNLTEDQENVISMKDISEKNAENEEKFQFIMVRSTTTDACYIVSKGYSYADASHKSFHDNKYFGLWFDDKNPASLKTTWSRSETANNVKWTFSEAPVTDIYLGPVFSQDENGYVSITHPTAACDYYYTTDGSVPSVPANAETAPTAPTIKYTGAFLPSGVEQINAIAVLKSNYGLYSNVESYNLPAYSKPSISFSSTESTITITSATEGATIYYTTDGSTEPTIDESVAHGTSPITIPNITNETTIKAIAINSGYTASDVETFTVQKVTTPTFELTADNKVKISSTTPGVTIYYTYSNEGEPSDPTISSTEYTAPLSNMSGYQFKAIAVKSDLINSDIGATSGAIKLKCAVPKFTRVGKGVSLASSFPASDVSYKYTIADNGAAPEDPKVSGVIYNGTIDLSSYTPTIIVKAYAFAEDYDDSDVSTFELTSWGTGNIDDPYYITTQEEFNNFITDVNNNSNGEASAYYKLITDVSGGDPITTAFSGSFEGEANSKGVYPKISGLTHALFNTINGGTVKNVMLDAVSISGGTNVGAIANVVTGTSSKKAAIYNCGVLSGSVSGSGYVGSIVGQLGDSDNDNNCYARVINCFSYATVSGGSDVGGIVGYNDFASTATNIRTMVMNCMFYGDITSGTNVSPVYGGEIIDNLQGGLNNFNYYAYEQLPTSHITSGKYNCALAVEEKYLNRFEYYRLLLNSNKKLAAFYATGTVNNANKMAKWVLETADRTNNNPYPYPILKAQDYYPSIINPDFENAPDSTVVGRNKGGQLGRTLSVTISNTKTDGGQSWPAGADITTTSLSLTRTDKDFDRFNFNYDKVQLPYYNDVGTGNYTGNRVVTGWKIIAITAIDGDPYTSANYPTTGITDYPNHNYADRKSSNKDLYSVSGRVFSQGAYFDVPYGVTSITIEPYWGLATYIADTNYDVVYYKKTNDYDSKQNVTQTGSQVSSGAKYKSQTIYTSINSTLLNSLTGTTVYDNAIVLVGNLHLNNVPSGKDGTTPFTMMSVDDDNDHEPDYSLIYHHKSRTAITPIRFDFLNIPGTAQAQKPNGASLICNFTIFKTKGWFEVTNTSSFYSSQLEYENQADVTKSDAPLILLGGVIDQFVSTQSSTVDGHTIYIHVGGNVWINSFGLGTHSDGSQSTPHVPVSVTGGEFPGFYLTGTYKADAKVRTDNAECYISGGYFHEAAGASLEQINGNVRWQIYNADIDNFFGGGINDAKPITGDVTVDIFNSYVTLFCGGPKFGNMQASKKVTTNAEGCTFGKYFGAGYGGTSYSKKKYYDLNGSQNWATLQGYYTTDRGKYFNGINTKSSQIKDKDYGKKGPGVATDFDYEFFVWSSGETGARLYVNFASFSLAQCNDVSSTLKKCTIEENFYGGGNLGKVVGTATSVLEDCTVKGSVYGAGFSASLPTVEVRDAGFTQNPNYNSQSGMFEPGVFSGTTTFTWENATTLADGGSGTDLANHILYTNTELTGLGEVAHTDLTIKGTTTVAESVYGGGEESTVGGNTEVNVNGGTIGTTGKGGATWGNVYGGGKGKENDVTAGLVKGNTNINISGSPTILHNIYGGGAYGSVGTFTYDATTGMPTALATDDTGACTVTIKGGTIGSNGDENGMVFGSSRGDVAIPEGEPAVDPNDRMAWVYSTHVTVGDTDVETTPWIRGSVYGSGENGHTFQNAVIDIQKGTIGIAVGETVGDYSGAAYPYRGNVYGGGCGTDKYDSDNDGDKDSYNPLAGIVRGTATVNITGGQVVHNVYGAGAMGSVGNASEAESGKTTINISGGRIGYDGDGNGHVFGAARGEFGVSTAASGLANVRETEVNINYTTSPSEDNEGKTEQLIAGSVFGGGEAGTVKGSVTVKMTGGLIMKDIYGGGALADTQTSNWDAAANSGAGGWAAGKTSASTTTTVRLTGGNILGEAYGGGLGETDKPAYVYGDVLLDLNGTTSSGEEGTAIAGDARGCAVHEVFGCNNAAGTPMGKVLVHVYATQNKNNADISTKPAKGTKSFDVVAVYGGGNLAAYEPVGGKSTTNSTNVIIDGCGLTSIQTVYGGGNAASTPATKLTVNGTFEIEEVFGGGNGKDSIIVNSVTLPNPGANVGFYAYDVDADNAQTPEDRAANYGYGSGKASVNIFGGTIHRVFGGSNTKGNVRQTAVTMLDEGGECDFCVDEAYGGGKSAPMDAEAKLLMACIPGLKAAYGGAEAADIQSNVTLNITNGTFDRVFGGNNISGTIRGAITVNVEEVGCKPIKIGELYGGGNQAGYSIYGYDSSGKPVESGVTPLYDDPQVNVMSFTSIGNIYGGGYGANATMVANPSVNVNVAYGRYYNNDNSIVGENAKTPGNYPIPSHAKGKMGAINYVFGGGNAAKVIGNTNVNIATLEEVYVVKEVAVGNSVSDYYTRSGAGTTDNPFIYTEATGTAIEGTTYYEKKDVVGADIRGNVFGGGNQAEVTGNSKVKIGKKEIGS